MRVWNTKNRRGHWQSKALPTRGIQSTQGICMSTEREIRLRITPASAAYFGTGRIDGTSCRHLRNTEDDAWKCGAFSQLIPIGRGMPPRLPECIAAEKSKQPWTEQRPTEPGYYWLSFPADNRPTDAPPVFVVSIDSSPTGRMSVTSCQIKPVMANVNLLDSYFDGTKWMPRTTPVDPFKESP